jgi:methanogenic corrinoid protein MtbC1
MVADVLEADGWNVRFLGTHLPHRDILDAIDHHEPRVIGISATVLTNLPAVSDLVEAARRRYGSAVAILVGGGAFRSRPDSWREIGADGIGRDLKEAVRIARELTSGGS